MSGVHHTLDYERSERDGRDQIYIDVYATDPDHEVFLQVDDNDPYERVRTSTVTVIDLGTVEDLITALEEVRDYLKAQS